MFRTVLFGLLAHGLACGGEPAEELRSEPAPEPESDAEPAVADALPDPVEPVEVEPKVEPAASPMSQLEHELVPEPEPEPVREPIMLRRSRQRLTVRAEPKPRAPVRGRIPMHDVFEVFALVDGPGCGGKGWADVGFGGFVCLEQTRSPGKRKPTVHPRLRAMGLVPFYYAKAKKNVPAPRWKTLEDFEYGSEPLDTLEQDHDYAFVWLKRVGQDRVLIDQNHRVVREKDVVLYRPSRFQGRDLEDAPVPPGRVLAWTVSWPKSPVHAEAHHESKVVRSLRYHEQLELEDAPVTTRRRTFYPLDGGGFIGSKHLRVFSIAAPPEGTRPDEHWIDINLLQQTLTVMRGPDAIYTTLVSSGFKRPTPRGVFRIHHKQALGRMQSNPGADERYFVEAVPYIQYFIGGFALHAAYWHHRFGHPISHGCVNLSPKDARRVYSLTSPHVAPGWLDSFESEKVLGTTVRIRRGDGEIRDRRGPVEPHY